MERRGGRAAPRRVGQVGPLSRDWRTWAALFAAGVLVCGCANGPSSLTSAGTPPETSAGYSAVSGLAVDRPHLPAVAVRPTGFTQPPDGTGLSGYLAQSVVWTPCGNGRQCATVKAPLDYQNPEAQAITLTVRRLAATEAPGLGVLFLNPGGPGASGQVMADTFARTGLEQYDLVAWDPRGTGQSTPIRCGTSSQADASLAVDQSPEDEAEFAALLADARAFAQDCWQANGALLEHVSTLDTARDLELLRGLLGASRVNFFGYSYGTLIGATYASAYPDRVGRMVLDAPVSPTPRSAVPQSVGFEQAFGRFAAWCAAQGCSLAGTSAEILTRTHDWLQALDSQPLRVGGRQLTQSLAAVGIAGGLYAGNTGWPSLRDALSSGLSGDGRALLALADAVVGRSRDGSYDTRYYASPAILCADTPDQGVADARQRWTDERTLAPMFGTFLGMQVGCSVWPVQPLGGVVIRNLSTIPILVIGATGDPATPYAWSEDMTRALGVAALLTRSGEGHGSYGGGSSCVDAAVVSYLTTGAVPSPGTRCA